MCVDQWWFMGLGALLRLLHRSFGHVVVCCVDGIHFLGSLLVCECENVNLDLGIYRYGIIVYHFITSAHSMNSLATLKV